jgi:hypothetical protein
VIFDNCELGNGDGDLELELTIRDRCGFADSRGPAAALPCVRCGAVPLGSKATVVRNSIQYGQVMQLSAKRGLTDDFLRTAAAAGVPSHTTFSQSPRLYHRARNVLSLPHAVASVDDSDDSSHLPIRISRGPLTFPYR